MSFSGSGICSNCGQPRPKGVRFCPSCGQALLVDESEPPTAAVRTQRAPGAWARFRAAVPLSGSLLSALLVVVLVAAIGGGVLASRTAPASKGSQHVPPTATSTPATTSPPAPTTTVLPTTTAAPTTTSTSTLAVTALPRVYSNGCPGESPATIEPTEIPLACADYNATISGIIWSSWTAESAHGTGTLNVNDCTPDCVGGTFHHTPTPVTLSDPAPSHTQGLVFSTVTFVMANGSPHSQDIGPTDCASNQYVHDC